jgi:hypothetical protein
MMITQPAPTLAESEKSWYSREFLREFRKPKPGPRSSYHEELREKTAVTIQRLIDEGLLQQCALPDLVAAKLSSQELRQLLQEHGRPAGKTVGKRVLAERALAVAKLELETKYASFVLYQCTPLGLDLVDRFDREKASAGKDARARALEFLKKGDITAAWKEYVAFAQAFERPWKRRSKSAAGGGPIVRHLEAVNWFGGRWSSSIQRV